MRFLGFGSTHVFEFDIASGEVLFLGTKLFGCVLFEKMYRLTTKNPLNIRLVCCVCVSNVE